jgi:hypothetical protein
MYSNYKPSKNSSSDSIALMEAALLTREDIANSRNYDIKMPCIVL